MDPILAYLIEFNKKLAIEYSDRFIIPVGGLQKMLDDFQGFHLNKVEVTKSELVKSEPPAPISNSDRTLDELYNLID